jgi:phosphonate dehydrogenase
MKNNNVNIVITNRIHAEVSERLKEYGNLVINPSIEPWQESEFINHLSSATAMMGFMTDKINSSVLLKAKNLKIIACALKGYDNYDIQACTHHGVWVSVVPDLLTEPTAELAIGLAISLARKVLEGDAYIRQSKFQGWRTHLYGTGLSGSNVAVIGLGNVGEAIVNRLKGFGCKTITGVDPSREITGVVSVSLEKAFTEADYVFLAVPLTDQTINLIDESVLKLSKPGQLIINVGRGSVVNEEAILGGLQSGQLAGFAADVFACEDWGLSNRPTSINHALTSNPSTLFTPHLGSAVKSVRIAIEHRAADNIIAYLEGKKPADAINVV